MKMVTFYQVNQMMNFGTQSLGDSPCRQPHFRDSAIVSCKTHWAVGSAW